MKLTYEICFWVITAFFVAAIVNYFKQLTDIIGPWIVARIAILLFLNGVWYLSMKIKTPITDKFNREKLFKCVLVPTILSILAYFVMGLIFDSADRRLSFLWDSRQARPFIYSGIGSQDSCPSMFKGAKGKTGLINEATICFSLTAPSCTKGGSCSVDIKILPRYGWEILGIETSANQPERIIWDAKGQIESSHLHQYKINALPCGDKIIFICGLTKISDSWFAHDIIDAISISFGKVNCPITKGGS